ncbi:hypothetical protein DFH06DRAFT_1140716 [Mycena polygramma]|nr:hypothetical protein DFH06DRAFT_1140716 [Mycena polygramma]
MTSSTSIKSTSSSSMESSTTSREEIATDILSRIGFVPGRQVAHSDTEELRVLRHDLDVLATGMPLLEHSISSSFNHLNTELEELAARIVGLTADVLENHPRSPENITIIQSLVAANDEHIANYSALGVAVNDLLGRLHKLEVTSTTTTGLQASIESCQQAIRILINRASANSGSISSAISIEDAAVVASTLYDESRLRSLIEEIMNSKRIQGESRIGNVIGRHRKTTINRPASFTYNGSALLSIDNNPSPRVEFSNAILELPTATRTESTFDVLLGPMDCITITEGTARESIARVLGPQGAFLTRYSWRQGMDPSSVLLSFESAALADWFIVVWNSRTRAISTCVARRSS